jgi:hypothetical protein
MTATMLSEGTESTLEPVDTGCTTNNSTGTKYACYDLGRSRRHGRTEVLRLFERDVEGDVERDVEGDVERDICL